MGFLYLLVVKKTKLKIFKKFGENRKLVEVKGGGKVGLVVLVFCFGGMRDICMYVYIERSEILKKKAFVKVVSSSGNLKKDCCCCCC